MNRRSFIALASTSLLLRRPVRARGDSILVSPDPMVVEFNMQSLDGRYTSTEDFYVRNHFPVPQVTGQTALRIEGKVGQALTLTPADLGRLKRIQLGAVLECAGNGTGPEALASNGFWEGWLLADVLALAKPSPDAAFLHLAGADGFLRSVPATQASVALLATHLNHQPLDARHGAPWRALIPGSYGMSSVKWLQKIQLSSNPLPLPTDEYAAQVMLPTGKTSFQTLEKIRVKSVITYPALGVLLHPGSVTVRGVAWTGSGKVAVVEVSVDGGNTWRVAQLDAGPPYEWSPWRYTIKLPEPGVLRVAAKAVDQSGAEQPMKRDAQRIDMYANNTIEQVRYLVE